MNNEQIRTEVVQLFEKQLGHSKIPLTSPLSSKTISGYDSLAQILIIASIEKHFGIQFKLKELAQISSIDSMVIMVSEKLSL